ncbi:HTH-type transcriptional regulator MalT [Zhongshania aliphaticivorans]|uniref:HTH-type transcriptional regulator MalT n=1 Tax=Zhongshania aliphaticivorans TaxID=1470434 RepID=A0A5S9Q3B5_9GAMM|nr:LuxR C-terminal-related transcriptional regulator [Zhongshania aliphaticivorans]CAA0111354.1 HTH-type transcriptional regulator MalT [Zhongshania aliphaticivorans]CAA0118584.1 HTH-type transcriptional regulator MalT [Zhongshania aliphaticivorans]
MTDIIETKLSPPYIRHKRMSRATIVSRVNQVLDDAVRLVTVVAPAGSGKSTLLVELYERYRLEGYACSWLSLEPGDDDPRRFARYIVAAIAAIDKGFAEQRLAVLRSSSATDLSPFFDSIIQYLAATDRRFALFVDDFHAIENPVILQFWTRYISYMSASCRAVIASRFKVSLDLSRLKLAGGLVELGQVDLNLSMQETGQFMKELHNVELPAAVLQLLHDRTEGWMVGLQLAGMTMSNSSQNKEDIVRSFSARDRNLKEYLFESVYGLQDEATRHFLLHTAPLNRFCAELCDVVTATVDGEDRLAQLEAANLFIIPLDREGRWYRYHHLFSEYLENQLQRLEPGVNKTVCALAADWCIAEGYVLEAIQYCLDAADYEKATDLIADHAQTVAIGEGNHSIVFEWMRKLPKEYQYRRPEIMLHHAWSRVFTRDGVGVAVAICDEFTALLDKSEANYWVLTEQEVQSLAGLCSVIRCIASACIEELDICIGRSKALLTELPKTETALIASAAVANAYAHYLNKDLASALSSATDAFVYGRRGGSAYAAIWGDFVASMANAELGHIQAAEDSAARAALSVADAMDGGQMAALAALAKVEVDCQRCDFTRIERSLNDNRVISRISSSPEPLLVARCAEARYLVWAGELDAALALLRQSQDMAVTMDMPRLYFAFIAEEIELLLHKGDIQAARETVRRTDMLNRQHRFIDKQNRSAVLLCIDLSEARLSLAENKASETLRQLSPLIKVAQQQQRIALTQQLCAMKSLALWRVGKEAEAVRELAKVVNHAAPESHIYPIYRVGSGLLAILQRLHASSISTSSDQAQAVQYQCEIQLIALFNGGLAPESEVSFGEEQVQNAVLAEPLTDRQLEILRLIGGGLGNKELAEALHISLSTAKWHVHNIFEKLGVRNRTSAVAYARKNNLL